MFKLATDTQTYEAAIKLGDNGQYDKALKLYESISEVNAVKLFCIATTITQMAESESEMRRAKNIYDLLALKMGETSEELQVNALAATTKLCKILDDSGRGKEALEIFLRASQYIKDSPILFYNIGRQYERLGIPKLAITWLEKTLSMDSKFIDAYLEINRALKYNRADPVISIKVLLGGLEHISEPDDRAKLHKEIGTLYSDIDFDKCLEHYKQALKLTGKPAFAATILMNTGNFYMRRCNIDEGRKYYLKAMELDPAYSLNLDNYAMCVLYTTGLSDANIWAEMRLVGSKLIENHRFTQQQTQAQAPESAQRNKKLRIGYVSADLIGEHPVSRFASILFTHYDESKFEVYCYFNQPEALVAMVESNKKDPTMTYRCIYSKSTEIACSMISADNIDMLVDLSGHTNGNRLDIFCNRVAPLQFTYIGFPYLPAIDTIDGFVGDSIMKPGVDAPTDLYNRFMDIGSESCYTFYAPTSKPPSEIKSPFFSGAGGGGTRTKGKVIFGAFNKANKTNSAVRNAYYRILKELPLARLVVKDQAILELMNREFPDVSSRVSALGKIPDYKDFLNSYNTIDFCLDTFPWTGTTTTCESLLMGTPVITLAGESYQQKSSASILIHSGLTDFVEYTVDGYVSKAVWLANNLSNPRYKHGTRELFVTGKVMSDPIRYVRGFEKMVVDKYISKIGN